MNTKRLIKSGMLAVLFLILAVSLAFAQAPLGTAFTYQGQLKSEGQPYTGTCDFQFGLYDVLTGGTSLGNRPLTEVPLTEGYFTVQLDFGADAFTGEARYLDISVRCPAGTGDYTQLQPRQQLTAAPYALYATSAEAAETAAYAASADSVPWIGISGMPGAFADGIDNDTTYGAGSGLTLTGTTFAVNTATIQARVSGVCGTGNAIRQIAADGTVTCEPVGGANAWSLTGNAGTTPGTNYLGTSDDQAFEIKVNNQRVFRFEPNTDSPNLIGGSSGNAITTGVFGATISGGGAQDYGNSVTDHLGTVGGGAFNQAGNDDEDIENAIYATISGGRENLAIGECSTIGGGEKNSASNSYSCVAGGSFNRAAGNGSYIGGGYWNNAEGFKASIGGGLFNVASGDYSAICGGHSNHSTGYNSFIGGGNYNFASAMYATVSGGGPIESSNPMIYNKATDNYCTIGGGGGNQAGNADEDLTNAIYATVAGGKLNIASGAYSAIGGGSYNTASATYATVSGGGPSNESDPENTKNKAMDNYCTIGGGGGNQAGNTDADLTNVIYATVAGGFQNTASGAYSAIGGGDTNTASGMYSTIPGGYGNTASGKYSFAAGEQAQATHDGSFVWADAQDAAYSDHGVNTFNVRAQNGAFIDAATTVNPGLKVDNIISGTSAGQGTAVLGLSYSNSGYGLAGWNFWDGVGVGAWSYGGNLIEAYAGDFMGESDLRFYVDNAGNVRYAGTSAPMVAIPSPTGGAPSYVSLYGLAAAEAWYEDLGASSLVSGKVDVSIDPLFAQTVNLTEDYQVQVTATCNEPVLLYVSEKTTTYFTVQGVRLDGKPSNCAFDYRISAKAVGYETVRLEAVDIPEPVISEREE